MPRVQAKVEGKGNGIKTVLVNMVDVARSLARPPTYVTKFFGCELGAQTNADVKNDRYSNLKSFVCLFLITVKENLHGNKNQSRLLIVYYGYNNNR